MQGVVFFFFLRMVFIFCFAFRHFCPQTSLNYSSMGFEKYRVFGSFNGF